MEKVTKKEAAHQWQPNEPWLSNRDVKIRLMQNAVDCGMAKSRQGWGLLNPEGMLRIK